MKKSALLASAVLFAAAALHAQSAEKISQIITTQKTTYAQAAYLAATFQDDSESLDEAAAFTAMVDAGFLKANCSADEPIPLKKLAKLYMQVTGIRGGLFYSIFHTPRYAYRELKAQGIIPEKADPSQPVSGRDTIAVLNGCISLSGGAE